MTTWCFNLALFFQLVASGGFIVYIVKQHRWVFRWAYGILLLGFALAEATGLFGLVVALIILFVF